MRAFWVTAVLVFVIDQVTKLAVVFGLNLIERGVIEVWHPFLTFRMAWNRGINFGLFASHQSEVRWLLIAVALAVSAWVLRWMMRSEQPTLARISAGFLVGGAIGNVVDRIAYGAVADFLNMSCCGIENPYAFNVADIAIFVGAVGLVLFARDAGKDDKARTSAGRKTP
ncbi:signal peptidase II [Aliigemmobacter aestuarii]|uniref:Lipoprotein signal peptidase n=1 Tax=Aliigemmobacter aestuarii TaxID=1445661 RepID=A0A4S3MMV3_9RHOB|nr:signal peptidase II [Gemmobacter aestuarii]THD83649.1 signal peptidase II [Gemmobacter aestuarii]